MKVTLNTSESLVAWMTDAGWTCSPRLENHEARLQGGLFALAPH